MAIVGEIDGGIGNGLRAFHVHEKGELGNDCKDAGGHFNPFNVRFLHTITQWTK